jgi:immune inhibitor A
MIDRRHGRYDDGPTRCGPRKEVVRSIRRELAASRALSRGDVRMAATLGLVSSNSLRPLGMNDSLFYPVEEVMARARRGRRVRPMERVSRQAIPRKLHALCLLADFGDRPGKRSAHEFRELLFDRHHPGSMTRYYTQLSRGKLTVTGEVHGYLRMPHPYPYYVNGENGTSSKYPHNVPGLLFDALAQFCRSDNLGRFDSDGDGYVDGLFLVHAGPGAEAEPRKEERAKLIWSHKWTLPKPFVSQGVKAYAYSTEPEDGRLGVFAHEFGHVLGLPDLYDTTYRSGGIGDWCLMSGGEWGGDGDRPTRMSAWCLSRLGWIKPRYVAARSALALPALAESPHSCYRLWTRNDGGPEYFLIENRQKKGMNAALPGSGLAVWHVDETQTTNDHASHYLVGLVQADGDRGIELNRDDGDAADLFPGSDRVTRVDDGTKPSLRAHDGDDTGVALSGIRMRSGVVTLRVTTRVPASPRTRARRARRPARRAASRGRAPRRRP